MTILAVNGMQSKFDRLRLIDSVSMESTCSNLNKKRQEPVSQWWQEK